MKKEFKRDEQEGMIAGVCAGLGDYWQTDKTLIRLIFVVALFFGFAGVGLFGPILYVILWIAVPAKSHYHDQDSPNNKSDDSDDDIVGERDRNLSSKDKKAAGFILIIIGAFLLLLQFDLFSWHELYLYWPLLLIALGLFHVASAFDVKHGKRSRQGKNERPA